MCMTFIPSLEAGIGTFSSGYFPSLKAPSSVTWQEIFDPRPSEHVIPFADEVTVWPGITSVRRVGDGEDFLVFDKGVLIEDKNLVAFGGENVGMLPEAIEIVRTRWRRFALIGWRWVKIRFVGHFDAIL